MSHYNTPPPPPPEPITGPTWEHVERAEKSAKAGLLLAAVALLVAAVALTLAIVAVARQDRGDGWRDNVCVPTTSAPLLR